MGAEGRTRGPLSGVRVADFSVHAAGPFAGLMLAELGAQVIKIESAARLDITRRPHSMYGKPPSSFEQVNANKLSACLNLKEPMAVDLALELVRISDLVLENFRPGVMDRLGLGYPQLRRVKPDIILVSLCSNGQTGPERGYAGYAPMFAALGGLGHLTGYPDSPPVELRHAMDHTGGMLAAFCAVAALCARSEGGSFLGQHVDVSVRDMGTAFIGPALLDYAMNRREAHRQGNRDEVAAPQGVYRCRGEDAWVSISVASEDEWQGLLRALGRPPWSKEPKFGDAYQRWFNQDELDLKLGDWTRGFTPPEVTERLQREGVAAFPSLNASQLMADPHLQAREAFPIVEHPEKGRQRAVSPPWRFSRTPARLDRWTPSLGEDNVEVFHGLIGLSVAEVKALEETRVIW
jgi:benzylsuccinate CoA-transferase BbsF subunit